MFGSIQIHFSLLLATGLLQLILPNALADDLWGDFYAARAAQYKINSTADAENDFQLRPKPLLTYTNPIRGRDQTGALFAWTQSDRPVFFATIWSIADANNPALRRTAHEFYSLLDDDVSVLCPPTKNAKAIETSKLDWTLQPRETKPIQIEAADIGSPMESPSRRLIQMKRIADRLQANAFDRKDNRARPLRLMPTPLMRFKSPSLKVADGAVFALVLATDPEILIVIEAVEEDNESGLHWRLTPVRFTGTELQLGISDKEIWRVPKIDIKNQSGPYHLQIGVSKLQVK